jgi:hypothetical protein
MLNKIKELNNMTTFTKNQIDFDSLEWEVHSLKIQDLVDNGMRGRVEWNIEKANHFFNLAFELLKREFGLSYKDATPIINRFIKESKVAI